MAGVVPTCHAVLVAGAPRARIVRALRAQRVCPCGAWVSVPYALPPTHRAVSVQHPDAPHGLRLKPAVVCHQPLYHAPLTALPRTA
eukprot:5721130-Pleurochrysis_carterae.AAC.1